MYALLKTYKLNYYTLCVTGCFVVHVYTVICKCYTDLSTIIYNRNVGNEKGKINNLNETLNL